MQNKASIITIVEVATILSGYVPFLSRLRSNRFQLDIEAAYWVKIKIFEYKPKRHNGSFPTGFQRGSFLCDANVKFVLVNSAPVFLPLKAPSTLQDKYARTAHIVACSSIVSSFSTYYSSLES